MLQRDGVVMMVMKVLVAMVMIMMILMKPSSMTVTMAMISLPPGRNFARQIFVCRRTFSLCVCFPPRRGGGVFL
jgi:hypothetical protein